MKRVFGIGFAVFLFVSIVTCEAQIALPADNPIDISSGRTFIVNFQNLNPIPVNRHPSSFLLNANDLSDYLAKTKIPLNDCYLHIYFASRDVACTDVFLVIAGTVYLSSEIVHDPTLTNVLCTKLAEPNCGTLYDKYLDGNDHNAGDIALCNTVPIEKKDRNLKTWLTNYQNAYPQGGGIPFDNTQSFLICANSLRDYLLDPQGTVEYIQFYIGRDPSNKQLNKDHLTLVVIGVDGNGKHIPGTDIYGNGSNVFNESIPCPKCYVNTDIMDNVQQFIGPKYVPFNVKTRQKVKHKTR